MATTADLLHHQVAADEFHDVTIEKLVYGGDGLAHIGTQAVFVPYAAVGDLLRIKITDVERNYARGVIDQIISPAPSRRTPPCANFGVCGGCQLQHLEYQTQLEAKVGFVRESMRRLGNIEWDGEIDIRSASEFGYRSRAEIKVACEENGQARIGYFRAATQDVCEVTDCLNLVPVVNRELHHLKSEACIST